MEEMRTVYNICLKKSQGIGTGAPWDVWGGNIEMLLKKILYHEVTYTYKTKFGSPL